MTDAVSDVLSTLLCFVAGFGFGVLIAEAEAWYKRRRRRRALTSDRSVKP